MALFILKGLWKCEEINKLFVRRIGRSVVLDQTKETREKRKENQGEQQTLAQLLRPTVLLSHMHDAYQISSLFPLPFPFQTRPTVSFYFRVNLPPLSLSFLPPAGPVSVAQPSSSPSSLDPSFHHRPSLNSQVVFMLLLVIYFEVPFGTLWS